MNVVSSDYKKIITNIMCQLIRNFFLDIDCIVDCFPYQCHQDRRMGRNLTAFEVLVLQDSWYSSVHHEEVLDLPLAYYQIPEKRN